MSTHTRMLLSLIVVTPVFAQSPETVARLRIRPEVTVAAPPTLADVLMFPEGEGELRERVGSAPVSTEQNAAHRMTVTHEQLEQRLYTLGVDLGQVLLSGAAACQVRVQQEAETPQLSEPPVTRAAVSQPGHGGLVQQTLEEAIRGVVAEEMAALGGTADIDFEQAARPLLALTSPPYEFVVRAAGHEKLGLREFRVVIRRDGKTQRSVNVYGRVRLSKKVLVAEKPLSVGSFVGRDDVVAEARLFERESDVGCDKLEEVIGQQVAQFVPKGGMLSRSDLKSIELVRRSRPVSVLGMTNNIAIRTTGIALDSGGYGETVRVRLGEQRGSRDVVRALVTGLGSVRVLEEGA